MPTDVMDMRDLITMVDRNISVLKKKKKEKRKESWVRRRRRRF